MTARFKRASFCYEPFRLEIDFFADPERVFSAHFLGDEPSEHPEPPFYGFLWPAAEALSQFLWKGREQWLRETAVLELGCGLALPSLVCALAGAEVTALDHHPDAWQLLEQNLQLNRLSLKQYTLGSFTNSELELGRFSLIIASDILYDAAQHPQLFAFIKRHLRPGGHALITDPGRYPSTAFVSLLNDQFLYEKRLLPHPRGEAAIDLHILRWEPSSIELGSDS